MKLRTSRRTDLWLNFLLNDCLPPVLRDRTWLLSPMLRLACGKKAGLLMDFRERAYGLTDEEFAEIYADLHDAIIDRPTDLNDACVHAILRDAAGPEILEVGCGRGFLAEKLAHHAHVTATDVALDPKLTRPDSGITYLECAAEKLPFADRSFDTVVCAHTLEHVRDLYTSIAQLRRVCRKRLIVVLPCERPYRHSFNLHIHFFPYASAIYAWFGKIPNASLTKLAGDWYYVENL